MIKDLINSRDWNEGVDRFELVQTIIYPVMNKLGYNVFDPSEVKVLDEGYRVRIFDGNKGVLADIHIQGKKLDKELPVNILTDGQRYVVKVNDGEDNHDITNIHVDDMGETEEDELENILRQDTLEKLNTGSGVKEYLIHKDPDYIQRHGYVEDVFRDWKYKGIPDSIYDIVAKEVARKIDVNGIDGDFVRDRLGEGSLEYYLSIEGDEPVREKEEEAREKEDEKVEPPVDVEVEEDVEEYVEQEERGKEEDDLINDELDDLLYDDDGEDDSSDEDKKSAGDPSEWWGKEDDDLGKLLN